MRLRRVWQLVVLAAALAAIFAGLVYRSWVVAQGRATIVLSTALDAPVLTWVAEVLTDEPRVKDEVIAGTPTTVVRPGGDGPWPAVVFLNGVTRRGRHHPTVRRLANGLARAGYLVLVPDPPGLARGEVTARTLASSLDVVRAAAARPDARHGRVSVLGVSAGASLALLVAEDPSVAGRVALAGGIAPYTDLRDIVRLATTGYHLERGRLVRYEAKPFMTLVIGRSLVAGLPAGVDRAVLLDRLQGVDDDARDPLAVLRRPLAVPLRPATRALLRLLLNRDPRRFVRLYAALSLRQREGIRRLSPILDAGRLRARVELASAPHDKYFPTDESRGLVERAPDARLTVTRSLAHAVPKPSVRDIADLFRLDGFLVRSLHAAG